MDNFIEKWKNDKKFRTLVKLIAYTIFVIIAAVYALSLDANTPDKTKYLEELKKVKVDLHGLKNQEIVGDMIDK